MRKLLREDGLVLIISVVIMFLAYRGAVEWGWHFLGAGVFALALGAVSAVVAQVLIMLIANKQEHDSAGGDGGLLAAAEGEAERREAAERNYDGSASGTGAEHSGPRGPVERPDEYRSSLEDPQGSDEPHGGLAEPGREPGS